METRRSVKRSPPRGRLRIAATAVFAALLAACCATQAGADPPFGVPPGQAKKLAAQAAGGSPPGLLVAHGHGKSAAAHARRKNGSAPGQVKKAARAGANAAAPAAAVGQAAAAVVAPVTSAPSAAAARRARPGSGSIRHRRVSGARVRAHAAALRLHAEREAVGAEAAAATRSAAAAAPIAATAAPARPAGTAPPAHRAHVRRAAHRDHTQRTLGSFTSTVASGAFELVEVFPHWAKAVIASLGLALLLAGATIAAIALNNRRLRRQRAALLAEVGALHGALLPAVPEQVGELEVSVAYRPAEGGGAGGDFYDVFSLDRDCVGIIIGDVAGHGRGAVGPAMFVRHMVRSYIEAGLTPRAAIQLAGNVLDDQEHDDFATVVAALYDPDAGTLAYATAGHPPPIICGPAAHEPLVVASSPPVGTGTTTGLRQTTVALPPGSAVCFFTDGLTEARTGAGVFGRERLERAVYELGEEATAEDLVEHVATSSDAVPDDVAVCVIRPVGGASAGTVRVEEIEVTQSDLHSARLRDFLDACGLSRAQAALAIRTATPRVAGLGSVLLRVRMADDRSGVDVVPVESARPDELARVENIR